MSAQFNCQLVARFVTTAFFLMASLSIASSCTFDPLGICGSGADCDDLMFTPKTIIMFVLWTNMIIVSTVCVVWVVSMFCFFAVHPTARPATTGALAETALYGKQALMISMCL